LAEPSRKRVLVADSDEIVAFIASYILSRYEFSVDTVTSAADLRASGDGYDAVVIADSLAGELDHSFHQEYARRAIILGDGLPNVRAFARLPKPIELDLLVTAVSACAGRRT
jgi:CheY-like chemotaxis protein